MSVNKLHADREYDEGKRDCECLNLSECNECGVAVSNWYRHTQWHESLDERIAAVRIEIAEVKE